MLKIRIIVMFRRNNEAVFCLQAKKPLHSGSYEHRVPKIKSVALSRYEKMCVLHVRKKLSHLQLGSQSDEYG